MTTSSDTDRDRAEDEAATWLIVLSEAPDDASLRERFDAWLVASPMNAESWMRVGRAYDLIGQVSPRHSEHWAAYPAERHAVDASPAGLPSESVGRGRRQGAGAPRRWKAGVGLALVAAMLLLAIVPDLHLRLSSDAVTTTAQVRALTLPDGSRLRLAPKSAVDVVFENGERRVRLLKGAGFFEVVPDRVRPFRVEAGNAVVTVLGTAFEVKRSEDSARIFVRRGHVRVSEVGGGGGVVTDLHAGDWVETFKAGGRVLGAASPEDVALWLEGRLVARDLPAREVVAALRPYYRGTILVRSQRFDQAHVSGIYDLSDPVSTLRALAAAHGGQVRQISPWVVVLTD